MLDLPGQVPPRLTLLVDKASQRYVDAVGDAVHEALRSRTASVYLHGPAVLGGYDVRRSDLDVLVVSDVALDIDDQRAPARGSRRGAAALPRLAAASSASLAARFRSTLPLGVASAVVGARHHRPRTDTKAIDGTVPSGAPDLRAALRRRAKAPAQLVRTGDCSARRDLRTRSPDTLILAQLADEMTWGAAHAATEYAVLNACRAWKYAVDGTLVFKVDGGDWVLMRPTDADVEQLVRRSLVSRAREQLARLGRGDAAQVRRRGAGAAGLVQRRLRKGRWRAAGEW